jgi:hypothetical protein
MPSATQIEFAALGLIATFLVAWASIHFLVLPRLGVCLLYLYTWFIAVFIVWTGIILALVGWVIPMLKDESTLSVKEKIIRAALTAVLLYVGKQLLELRHLKVAAKVMKWIFKQSFKGRVPTTLPLQPVTDPSRLAYQAVYDENFVIPNVNSVLGWGMVASCRRVRLVEVHVH